MKKAIIFDFDGVIVESEEARYKFLQNALKEYSIFLQDAEIPPSIGLTTKSFLEKTTQDTEIVQKVFEKFKREYKGNIFEYITPIQLTHTFIKEKPAHIKFAMASMNSLETIKQILQHFELIKNFDALVALEDVKNHKPHPEIYLKAAKQLGVKPADCMVIEDTVIGAKAALAAGMDCYIIKNKYNDQKHFNGINIKGYIHSIEDLQKLI